MSDAKVFPRGTLAASEADCGGSSGGDLSLLTVPPGPLLPAAAPTLSPPLSPPNFGTVLAGRIYRSSFPEPEHVGFLRQLKLGTVVTLIDGRALAGPVLDWLRADGIEHVLIPLTPNKRPKRQRQLEGGPEPEVGSGKEEGVRRMEEDRVRAVLESHLLAVPPGRPVLVHCNKGRHRTGCVVACLRKLAAAADAGADGTVSTSTSTSTSSADAALAAIVGEYRSWAAPKAREEDVEFISRFRVAGPDA